MDFFASCVTIYVISCLAGKWGLIIVPIIGLSNDVNRIHLARLLIRQIGKYIEGA